MPKPVIAEGEKPRAVAMLQGCLARGVYLHHVSPHHGYSSAHTMADIDETLGVMDEAAAEIGG
jgi:glutamate-1-semialdehyde aminotransferase